MSALMPLIHRGSDTLKLLADVLQTVVVATHQVMLTDTEEDCSIVAVAFAKHVSDTVVPIRTAVFVAVAVQQGGKGGKRDVSVYSGVMR
jgi:7-cyano-7-deazaguanine synthase in queuosine biosynthesis